MLRVLAGCLILLQSHSSTATVHPASQGGARNISLLVFPDGNVRIGRDTITINDLTAEIHERLWKSYTGTGKMYDSIIIHSEGEIPVGTRDAVQDAVKLGQEKALAELCILKYRRTYENLSETQQRKLKKQFPVLFQKLIW